MKSLILPTEDEIRALVDTLITNGEADREAAAFIRLLLPLVDDRDDDRHPLALLASHHAFSKTLAFHEAFEKFREDSVIGAGIVDPALIEAETGNN